MGKHNSSTRVDEEGRNEVPMNYYYAINLKARTVKYGEGREEPVWCDPGSELRLQQTVGRDKEK